MARRAPKAAIVGEYDDDVITGSTFLSQMIDQPESGPTLEVDGSGMPFMIEPSLSPVLLAEEGRMAISRVWGSAVLAKATVLSAIRRVQEELDHQGGKMLSAAIQIGRALVSLRAEMTPEEFARGMRQSRQVFRGWSAGNLSKMMAVAEFVDRRQLNLKQLPSSVGACYSLTHLEEPQLQKAREVGLLRPETTRAEVEAFRRSVSASGVIIEPATDFASKEAKQILLLRTRLRELDDERRLIRVEINRLLKIEGRRSQRVDQRS